MNGSWLTQLVAWGGAIGGAVLLVIEARAAIRGAGFVHYFWAFIALGALIFGGAEVWQSTFGRKHRMQRQAIREAIAAGATIVDVRTPEEFGGGAFPKALNIPIQDFERRFVEIPRDRPVVLYCRSGRRSAVAAAKLRQAGYEKILDGGGLDGMPR